MTSNIPTSTIKCPQCQQPILARMEQILDVGQDPDAKGRLLSGKFNLVNCPSCGFAGMIGTPIVYHDPEHELLLTYVPVELSLPLNEKERVLGSLTRTIISNIESDKRTGYLLQPKEMLSIQGLITCVLEADGITAEMIESQRTKLELMAKLSAADDESLAALIKENDSELDYSFFQLLTAASAQAAEAQDTTTAEKYIALRQQLLKHSTFGQETQAQASQLQAAAKDLESLGKKLDRTELLKMIMDSNDDERITALATLARPLLDYEFFLQLTEKIDEQTNEAREKLEHVRDIALKAVNQADAVAKARSEALTQLLELLMETDDLQAVIKENLNQFDELFLGFITHNQEAAKKSGDVQTSKKLEAIRDAIIEALHDSAPPEIRFVNELLSLETDEEASAFISARASEMKPEMLKTMESIAEELKASGRKELGERLDTYRKIAEKEIALAKWR